MYDILTGVTVYEASAFVAAPLAGLSLVQSGACVIRIDPPGGGLDYRRMPRNQGAGESLFWTNLNRGKASVCIDLRKDEGAELAAALVADSSEAEGGIFLTNLPQRPVLRYEALAASRKDVLRLEVLGNFDGSSAVDYTVNPATGIPMLTGADSHANPTNHVLPAWDIACGFHAAQLMVALLYRRSRTRQGANATIALSDVAFSVLGHLGLLAEAVLNGDRAPNGNYLFGGFGRDFVTADRRRIMVVALTARQWKALLDALQLHEEIASLESAAGQSLGDEQVRFEHRYKIAELVGSRIARLSLKQIEAAFSKGVSWSPYLKTSELIATDPRLSAANPIWQHVPEGLATIPVPGAAFGISDIDRKPPASGPVLGADTEAILTEKLGLTGTQFGTLVDRGIVA